MIRLIIAVTVFGAMVYFAGAIYIPKEPPERCFEWDGKTQKRCN